MKHRLLLTLGGLTSSNPRYWSVLQFDDGGRIQDLVHRTRSHSRCREAVDAGELKFNFPAASRKSFRELSL
jgi:hypothetical protein